jgi:hypothetical protein
MGIGYLYWTGSFDENKAYLEDGAVGPATKHFVNMPRPGLLDLLIPLDIAIGEHVLVAGSTESVTAACKAVQDAHAAAVVEFSTLRHERCDAWTKLDDRITPLRILLHNTSEALRERSCPWSRRDEENFKIDVEHYQWEVEQAKTAEERRASELKGPAGWYRKPQPVLEGPPSYSVSALRASAYLALYPTGFAEKYEVCDVSCSTSYLPVSLLLQGIGP